MPLADHRDSSIWVVIPAAGIGSRMEASLPKQYLKIQHKTILEHTLSCFDDVPGVTGILVVISESDPYWSGLDLVPSASAPEIVTTTGGGERSETVRKGLAYLRTHRGLSDDQWVMVHDAARPCVQKQDLLKLLSARDPSVAGAILASKVTDTMKRECGEQGVIRQTESREGLWHAQTPQMFRLGELYQAIIAANQAQVMITDEASAMEWLGRPVLLVEGASTNLKLTTPSDLPLLTFLLTQQGNR